MPEIDYGPAINYLQSNDSALSSIIQRVGPCHLKPQGGTFAILARSILSQQISVAAARTIRRRLMSLLPNRRLTAAGILKLSEEQLSSAGVSAQKRRYLLDLSHRVDLGTINFRRLPRLPDEEVIDTLVQVKGVGRWTAQMFLLFGLGRPDIFAPDDLAIRNAMQRIYELNEAKHTELEEIADAWRPHRSVASWYLWRSLELRSPGSKEPE